MNLDFQTGKHQNEKIMLEFMFPYPKEQYLHISHVLRSHKRGIPQRLNRLT